MTFWFGIPHSPILVVLSVMIAICSGYVGLGLASQAENAFGLHRRGLLAGAAWSLGLGIWTMHFTGMQAAQLPEDTPYSILLTLMSFLLCVLVVGVAAFIVSTKKPRHRTVLLAAVLMGSGIVVMHFVGMHAISAKYMMHHDLNYSALSAIIAVAASFGALRMFESEISQRALAFSALIFGMAVSGMHYTAMLGTTLTTMANPHMTFGPSVSSATLMIFVAVLAFFVSAVFLLYLVPEKNIESGASPAVPIPASLENLAAAMAPRNVSAVPVESDGATRLFPVAEIHAVQATTHYSIVFDGLREHFSPWSITEMESKLDPIIFMRVHRSHLVAVARVKSLRKSGDSAVLELGINLTRQIPVSRAHYAELKSRLGLEKKLSEHRQIRKSD